jgi:hypothetical protein
MPCQHDHRPLVENVTLDEMYYKDIMKEVIPGYLPHRDYSHLIKFVKFEGHTGNTQRYFVPNKYNGWVTYVRFLEWEEQVRDTSLSAPEAARLLFWGANIQVHCGCPAFLFWGSQYILTQLDAAIVPENRFPHIRNPQLKGIVCKHLNRTLKVLPFHLADMARAINEDRAKLASMDGGMITPAGAPMPPMG